SRIDPEMERQMKALLGVVTLGRACRNLANMKVRQPAQALYVKGASFDAPYAELAKDELNVKTLVFTEDSSAFTGYLLKPQLRTLGPRYGKLLGKISAVLKELDGVAAVTGFEQGEALRFTVEGTEVALEKDDVLIEAVQRPGLATLEERGLTVALSTVLTPELVREGYAREIISKLQTMRKDAGFEVTDRIVVSFDSGLAVTEAVEAFRDMVMEVVLAVSLEKGADLPEGYTQEWDINGEKAVLSVKKA
ncbi:MAG: isoleucine--tRNA ligase, partial [Clostridiales bacterium]|nr:isoleucine--tRNA ligase [Clostridiales bacterium]